MKITQTALFLAHREAGRYRFWTKKRSLVWPISLLLATLFVWASFRVITHPAEIDWLPFTLIGFAIFFSVGAVALVSPPPQQKPIEQKIRALADQYGVMPSGLLTYDLRHVSDRGRILLTERGHKLMEFEAEVKAVKINEASAYFTNLIYDLLDEYHGSKRRQMKYLYDLLLEFNLVPQGGYEQFFKKTESKVPIVDVPLYDKC